MWSSTLLAAGVVLYLRVPRTHFAGSDMTFLGSIPWYGLAGSVLLIRYYQGLLSRVSYMLLLFYWIIWVSSVGTLRFTPYSLIFFELLRSRSAEGGESDELGRHWTINITELIVNIVLYDLLDYLFPNWLWSRIVFLVFLSLVVFGHCVFQLFLQKQITRIVRLNRAIFKWRDYGVECFCYAVTYRLSNRATRILVDMLWWTCHQVYKNLTPELMDRLSANLAGLNIVYPIFYSFAARPAWFSQAIGWILVYRLWLRELARFSNPNPSMYKYSKLEKPDHIRLVLLHPRFGFRPVSCSVVEGPHMRLLFYEAISYTWGDIEPTEEILVDGCRMKVTKSVYEILATFSSQFLPQLLWIDAICIDQNNNEEKEGQVPMMDKIYSHALFTTVFLGQSSLPGVRNREGWGILPYRFDGIRPQDDQTRENFETARLTFDLFNEFRILESPLRRLGKDVYEDYESSSPTASKPRQWSALLTFLQHPWFARVWVVQEVALSPVVKVRYGDEVIDWKVIANALKMIHSLRHFRLWLEWSHGVQIRHTEHSSLYNIIRMDNLREKLWPLEKYRSVKDISITQVLAQSFYFKATNPRDQVYGLMSLCKNKNSLKVDYRAPVESVYLAAATELVRSKSFGLLFSAAGVGNRSESGSIASKLPSWVPDWTNAPKYDRIHHPEEDDYSYRSKVLMGQIQPPQPFITLIGDKILRMSATLVDTIVEIGPALFDSTVSEYGDSVIDEMCRLRTNYDNCQAFLAASPLIRDTYVHAMPQQSLLDAFHRSIVTDRDVQLIDWVLHLKYFRYNPYTGFPSHQETTYAILKAMDKVTDQVESYCGGRRLFVGSKGWIGLCPPGTQKGDAIWVVRGVKIPIILRKTVGDADERYKLVGECHCQGLRTGRVGSPTGAEDTIEVV